MPARAAPIKTPEGLDELQSRSRRLSQRHRTVLLLVDGKRPLGEILAMAIRAGAGTTQLEELIALGLVEVPSVQVAQPEDTGSDLLDSGLAPLTEPGTLTELTIEVPVAPHTTPLKAQAGDVPPGLSIESTAALQHRPPQPRPDGATPPAAVQSVDPSPHTEVDLLLDDGGPETVANPDVLQPPAESQHSPPAAVLRPAPAPVAPSVQSAPPRHASAATLERRPTKPATASAPPKPPVKPMAATVSALKVVERRPRAAPAKPASEVADHARPRPAPTEPGVSQRIRTLLGSALGSDSMFFSKAIWTKLRLAEKPREFIAVVWDIERQRCHVNRSREQLISLQTARELLGMGNTVVSMDLGADTEWPDTVV